MARTKNKFVCQECGYTTPRELGKCPGCQAWSSFAEETEIISNHHYTKDPVNWRTSQN